MKVIDVLQGEGVHISFEVFPPKTEAGYEGVLEAAGKIAALKPSFMSVTYGAGGGTSAHTQQLSSQLCRDYGVESLAHLTCASSAKTEVAKVLSSYQQAGIENILALRGDRLPGETKPVPGGFQYAYELVEFIKQSGDFCIGAACYPEGHVESSSKDEDILHLKHKVDCGVDFLTTQMFFDNRILYNFLYRIRAAGVTVPVVPGIMPVTNGNQIARICALSGTRLPENLRDIVEKFSGQPKAMYQAGIIFALEQMIELIANGIRHIHVYTMNKPEVARAIMEGLSECISAAPATK